MKNAGGRVVHRRGRAIFFSDTLWPSRTQFFIFISGTFFAFSDVNFPKSSRGKTSFLGHVLGCFQLCSWSFLISRPKPPDFSREIFVFSFPKKNTRDGRSAREGTYDITRGAWGAGWAGGFSKK